jgi:hypothetical protein
VEFVFRGQKLRSLLPVILLGVLISIFEDFLFDSFSFKLWFFDLAGEKE